MCIVHKNSISPVPLSVHSEGFVIFSGGLTYDKAGRSPSISVMHNKTTTVLEMEHNVVDFVTLCESPYMCGKSSQQVKVIIVIIL